VRKDIAVVLLDEESLDKYPYVVVDRALIADVVRGLDEAGAEAIGLDFAFVRPTEPAKDEALIEAIHNAKARIVLGEIDAQASMGKEKFLAFQKTFLERAGNRAAVGLVYFWGDYGGWRIPDQIVRYVSDPHPTEDEGKTFAEVLANLGAETPKPATPYIDWLLPPAEAKDIFQIHRIPPHAPGNGRGPTLRVIPEEWRGALKGKIVLVGASFMDRDRHLTPLSVVDGTKVAGVMIHAQILAQLLDGRTMYHLSTWTEALFVFALAALGYALGWLAKLSRYGFLVYVGGLLVLAAAGMALFKWQKLIIPTASLFLAWIVGVAGGHYSGWAVRKLRWRRGASAAG
jgi:CHASE2 domain-containing sensor protein